MAWVLIDDKFPRHEKARAVGLEGMGLMLAGLCWANEQLTNGVLTEAEVNFLIAQAGFSRERGRALVKRMVKAGLWETRGVHDFIIHDYLHYQRSRADVEAISEARAKAGRSGANARWGINGRG